MDKEHERLLHVIEVLLRDITALVAVLNSPDSRNLPPADVLKLREELRINPATLDFARREVAALREALLRAQLDTEATRLLRQFESDKVQ